MEVKIWVGLPYNKWYEWGSLPFPVINPFLNFILTKGDFCLQVITRPDGSQEISIKLPYSIELTI